MQKITYADISTDKYDLTFLISEMIRIYGIRNFHTSVLECNQWLNMLERQPIQTEYTIDALLSLKNILNDAANYLIAVENRWDDGNLAMNLMNKLFKLFKEIKNEKD